VPEPTELEARLIVLGQALDWPSTPDLAVVVGARIAVPRRLHTRGRLPWGARAGSWSQSRWALVAAVLLALVALFAYTPSRDAIANWLNLHTRFQQVPQLPTTAPRPPGPLGARLGLGSQTALSSAAATV
jgi:hypothetical protein